jgi:hypothetical protein
VTGFRFSDWSGLTLICLERMRIFLAERIADAIFPGKQPLTEARGCLRSADNFKSLLTITGWPLCHLLPQFTITNRMTTAISQIERARGLNP